MAASSCIAAAAAASLFSSSCAQGITPDQYVFGKSPRVIRKFRVVTTSTTYLTFGITIAGRIKNNDERGERGRRQVGRGSQVTHLGGKLNGEQTKEDRVCRAVRANSCHMVLVVFPGLSWAS